MISKGNPVWFCESSDLSPEDQKWIWDNVPHNDQDKTRSKVKGNSKVSYLGNVTYGDTADYLGNKKEDSNENISYRLAKVLDDLESLPYYEKLVSGRRSDFLRNCLIITLNANEKGLIKSSKAKYFTGVVKNKSDVIQRIRSWKKRNKR